MSCKFIKSKDFNAIQCSNISEYRYLDDGIFDPEQPPGEPYSRFECDHRDRYECKGVLTCKDCNAVYHEDSLSWY